MRGLNALAIGNHMSEILMANDALFENRLKTLLSAKLEGDDSLNLVVGDIIAAVRERGDAAVIDYTTRFDRFVMTREKLQVTEQEIEAAYSICQKDHLDALQAAADRIATYHQRQLPQGFQYVDDVGVTLGNRWTPVESVGLYVPGGLASYPSSVLMNAIPARVAGVKTLVMAVPAPDGEINPLVLAAAKIAAVDTVYRIGGAQAIAALAYGTETITPVDKIVGPGNAYVAMAKRQVFGKVGIDMIAGPSEILVVADSKNNPRWIAADLLSQAEHDKAARSLLITDDRAFAEKVSDAVKELLATLHRKEIATASWEQNGAIIVVDVLETAIPIVNMIAPEHLELAIDQPEIFAEKIHNAGAIFLGRYTPEAMGDYIAGPSHVLPTAGTARFSSGLSVFDFLKRISVIGCSEAAFGALSHPVALLAKAEGLDAHALSVSIRDDQPKKAASSAR